MAKVYWPSTDPNPTTDQIQAALYAFEYPKHAGHVHAGYHTPWHREPGLPVYAAYKPTEEQLAQLKSVLEEERMSVSAQVKQEIEKRAVDKEVQRRLAILETWEDFDEMPDATVIQFTKVFSKGGKVYTYVAIKINGDWYLTGKGRSELTSDQLREFMLGGNIATEVYEVATSWRLFDERTEQLPTLSVNE